MYNNFKENIFKTLRKQKNLTQVELANIMNVNQATVSKWENENLKTLPDTLMLQRLSEFYNVTIEELLNGQRKCSNKKQSLQKIPVLGKIPAGIPIEMIEDIIDYEEINPDMLRGGKEYFALKVKGDSMLPEFKTGDVLIVRKQDDCENGAYAIVAVNGDDATFKKVIKKEGALILQPLNVNYEPIIYTEKQIQELPVKILGVVVEFRRSF